MSQHILYSLGAPEKYLGENELAAFQQACTENGFQISTEAHLQSISEQLSKNPQHLLLVDTHTLALLLESHGFRVNNQTILLAAERESTSLKDHIEAIGNLHYIVSAYNAVLLKASFTTIFRFHISQNMEGLASVLLQQNTIHAYKHEIATSSERSETQSKLTEFFSEQIAINKEKLAAGISSYPKYMGDVLDELLMNAIWDANPERSSLDRKIAAKLNVHEHVAVEAICDGSSFSLSVVDSQGTFSEDATHKPMKYALGYREDPEINENAAGAGLGLYIILQKVAAVSFEVERGKMTRVTVVQRGDQSLREMQKRPRTVLFLQKN